MAHLVPFCNAPKFPFSTIGGSCGEGLLFTFVSQIIKCRLEQHCGEHSLCPHTPAHPHFLVFGMRFYPLFSQGLHCFCQPHSVMCPVWIHRVRFWGCQAVLAACQHQFPASELFLRLPANLQNALLPKTHLFSIHREEYSHIFLSKPQGLD